MQLNFDYKIIKSKRRSISIAVTQTNEVTVRAPLNCAKHQILTFLKEKESWIEKILKKNNNLRVAPLKITSGEKVRYLGKEYVLELTHISELKKVNVELFHNRITLCLPSEQVTEVERLNALRQWYIEKAKDILLDRVYVYADIMGLSFNQVRIKTLKSRWGSCSSLKNLNFNWVLMMCPIPVLDYVVIHELAHLVHMNHSRSFWDLVSEYCPDYRSHVNWLKNHQSLIYVI